VARKEKKLANLAGCSFAKRDQQSALVPQWWQMF